MLNAVVLILSRFSTRPARHILCLQWLYYQDVPMVNEMIVPKSSEGALNTEWEQIESYSSTRTKQFFLKWRFKYLVDNLASSLRFPSGKNSYSTSSIHLRQISFWPTVRISLSSKYECSLKASWIALHSLRQLIFDVFVSQECVYNVFGKWRTSTRPFLVNIVWNRYSSDH